MYTILICDDDKDIVSALDIYLTSEGYRTLKAYNGREAIRAVEQNKVHLILMDVMMPVMNGLEATRAIRAGENPLGQTIPILAMTANAFTEDIQVCLDAGMDAHVSKPLEISVLERTLLSVTGGNIAGGGHLFATRGHNLLSAK